MPKVIIPLETLIADLQGADWGLDTPHSPFEARNYSTAKTDAERAR